MKNLTVKAIFKNHCLVERDDGKYNKYYFVAHNPVFENGVLTDYSHSTGYGWWSLEKAEKQFRKDYK